MAAMWKANDCCHSFRDKADFSTYGELFPETDDGDGISSEGEPDWAQVHPERFFEDFSPGHKDSCGRS